MKRILRKFIKFLQSNSTASKAFHTFYQAFLGVFIVGISPVVTLIAHGSVNDAKVALFSLIGASLASGVSAIKTQILNRLQDYNNGSNG